MSRITLPILDAVTLTAACTQIVADARAAFERLAALPLDEVSPSTVLDEWDRIGLLVENIEGPVSILNNVHPDKAVRDAADDAIRQLASFQVEVFQNEALYARVQAVEPATPAEAQLRKDLVESFEDTGVTLPPDRRARAKAIADRITALYQEFSRNLRDNQSRMTFTAERDARAARAVSLAAAARRAGALPAVVRLPRLQPVHGQRRGRGRAAALLRRVSQSRHRPQRRDPRRGDGAAPRAGRPVRAARASRTSSCAAAWPATPEAVDRFLDEVRTAVEEAERHDIDELRALKAARLGRAGEQVAVTRWDIAFLSERLREQRYSVDQESLRKYFPPQATLDWLLDVSGEVFGLRFVPVKVPVWHDDVLYVDVLDGDDGRFIGGIYFDLYPREGKFPHAAAWPVRGVSTRASRTPVSVLVTNFDRRGLTHDEVETLFHEFGHILHGVLSETEFNFHAGTSVQRDFVETPSQIYEEWTRRLDSLDRMRLVSPDTPVMDASLVERLNQARRFGQGLRYAPAVALRLVRPGAHRHDAGRVDGRVGAMEGATALGHVERHRLSGHLRAHRRRLRGRILRLHVGRGHRARHAVGLRRHADQPGGRAPVPPTTS